LQAGFLVSADKANRTLADSHVRESCPHLRMQSALLVQESSNIVYESNQLGIKRNPSRQSCEWDVTFAHHQLTAKERTDIPIQPPMENGHCSKTEFKSQLGPGGKQ
jgi:hypothetical protein